MGRDGSGPVFNLKLALRVCSLGPTGTVLLITSPPSGLQVQVLLAGSPNCAAQLRLAAHRQPPLSDCAALCTQTSAPSELDA
eukprot:3401735-Rhodomonas_salina.3